VTFRSAIEGPIMEDGELAIGRRMHVDFDD